MCKITKENDSLQRQTENKDEDSQELQCNKNIPELRFPEFEGEWDNYCLEDICSFSKGKGISKKNIGKEGIDCICYGELYTVYNEVINKTISKTDLSYEDLILSKKNDVIIPSTGETAIDISQTSCITKDNVAIGGDINILKSKENGIFLSYSLNNNKKNIAKLAQGSTIIHLYADQLKKLIINVPSMDEQEKISNFINILTRKIELMEKEINKQSKYMKKIRENILNDNSDNSNKVQLKEICIINKGKQLNKTNMINDGKYYVLNGGKTPSGFTNSWNVPENTISISEGGNSCGFVNYNVQKFYCGGHCYYLTNISDEIDPLLLYHCLKMNENKIMNLRVGSGLPNIQKKDLEKYKLYIPTKNHEKITYLLNNINLKIDLNKEKLNHLKQFKKGLLQKMFC